MSSERHHLRLPAMPIPSLDSKSLPAFVVQPAIFGTEIQCSILRKKSTFGADKFEMFFESGNVFALSAKRKASSNYHMYTSAAEPATKDDPNYAGKVEKDNIANVFVIYGKGENYKKSKVPISSDTSSGWEDDDEAEDTKSIVTLGPRQQTVVDPKIAEFDIDFDPFLSDDELTEEQQAQAAAAAEAAMVAVAAPESSTDGSGNGNGSGSGEPKSSFREEMGSMSMPNILPASIFTLLIPPVTQQGIRRELRPVRQEDSLLSFVSRHPHKFVHLISRKPLLNQKTGRLQMDFYGRAKVASIKNQQLILGDECEKTHLESPTILLFGKMDETRFALDFTWPLCPLQAFAIALVIFDTR